MFTINCKGRLLRIDEPLVMGIINATPDSFYAASRFPNVDNMLRQAEKMIAEEVDIIDVGGQSTRPGSKRISAAEELDRVIDGIEAIHKTFPDLIISVDTYYSQVAREAVQKGASMVNDISAGTLDNDIIGAVAKLKVPYIIMHMKATPETMQQEANYENVTQEVLDFLIWKRNECKNAGIHDIIIDPGFGFGKTVNHNFELLKNLRVFQIVDAPILVGLSRKSSVYKTLDVSQEEALNGTTVLNTIAIMNGASILRVHDVKQAKEAVRLFMKVRTVADYS